jgi:hypothetical protein
MIGNYLFTNSNIAANPATIMPKMAYESHWLREIGVGSAGGGGCNEGGVIVGMSWATAVV